MNDAGERDDWIRKLSETRAMLGRLVEQLEALEKEEGRNFNGMIQRIIETQANLDGITDALKCRRSQPRARHTSTLAGAPSSTVMADRTPL